MTCDKSSKKWKRAMEIARRKYPHYSLERRRKIAGAILGGLKKHGHRKKRRKE